MPCPKCGCSFGEIDTSQGVPLGTCGNCGETTLVAAWGSAPPRNKQGVKRRLDTTGSHGDKKREQKRLGTSGATHQSEHTIGYKVFAPHDERGGSKEARAMENQAAAYQEELSAHRSHVGTGSSHEGGDYRKRQRLSVSNHEIGLAVQYNQLCYAHQPEFRSPDSSKLTALQKADDSYQRMVDNFPPLPVATSTDGKVVYVGVSPSDKAEMTLARNAARTGALPNRTKEIEAMTRFGIIPSEPESPMKGPLSASLGLDMHGVCTDGNCLFHAFALLLARVHSAQPPVVTNQSLREQAVGFLRTERNFYNDELRAVVTDDYLTVMSLSGTWASELEAWALAYIWGVQLEIIGPATQGTGLPQYTWTFNALPGRPRIQLYYNGVNHYSIGPI